MAKKKKIDEQHTNGTTNGAAHDTTPPESAKATEKPELPQSVPPGSTERARYTEPLSTALTVEDVADLRARLVAATTERVAKEAEIAVLREAVKGLRGREESLVEQLNDGTREAPVECVEWLTPLNEIVVQRVDTGSIIERRTATLEDLQQPMFDHERDSRPSDPPDEPLDGQIDDPERTLGAEV